MFFNQIKEINIGLEKKEIRLKECQTFTSKLLLRKTDVLNTSIS